MLSHSNPGVPKQVETCAVPSRTSFNQVRLSSFHSKPSSISPPPCGSLFRQARTASSILHKYFFPAATTLARKTGLPKGVSTRQNGFMIAFNQTSKTSARNCRIASSVCGLVGLLAMLVLPVVVLPTEREDEAPVALRERVEGGREV